MDSRSTLALAADELTIAQAAAVHQKLCDAVATGLQQLDLSAVTDCDSAGVQLLLAARRSVQTHQGQPLQVHGASAAVRSALQRYGLLHCLDDAGGDHRADSVSRSPR